LRLEPVIAAKAKARMLKGKADPSQKSEQGRAVHELAKIEGWGDYFFYGFASDDGCSLAGYTLADLKCFRIWHSKYLCENKGALPGVPKDNTDGSSGFVVFRWEDIPEKIIVSQKL
jgi:hypothetical protein